MSKRLAGLLLLSLLLGVFSSLHFDKQGQEIPYYGYDEVVYLSLAKHILDSSPFDYSLQGAPLLFSDYRAWYLERPIFHHPPLFTWLLSSVYFLFGSSLLVGRFLSVIIGVALVYVTYRITLQVRGDERIALTSGFLLAVSPLHVLLSSLVLMDGLLTLFVSLFVLFTLQITKDGLRKKVIYAGLFLGLALLTKYSAILALPILVVFAVTRRISPMQILTILGVALALNSWWLLWNLKEYSISFITNYGEYWQYPNVIVPFYAYFYFLPVVAPAAILGYLNIVNSIKKRELDSIGLASIVLAYFVFFSYLPLKEMRFIFPMLPSLIILGGLWLYKIPGRSRKILTAILALFSLFSTYVVVKGGYYWYLPLWHLQDWKHEFINTIF